MLHWSHTTFGYSRIWTLGKARITSAQPVCFPSHTQLSDTSDGFGQVIAGAQLENMLWPICSTSTSMHIESTTTFFSTTHQQQEDQKQPRWSNHQKIFTCKTDTSNQYPGLEQSNHSHTKVKNLFPVPGQLHSHSILSPLKTVIHTPNQSVQW